jgi:hypothetical protein
VQHANETELLLAFAVHRPSSSPSSFYRELNYKSDSSDTAEIESLLRVPLSRWDDLIFAEAATAAGLCFLEVMKLLSREYNMTSVHLLLTAEAESNLSRSPTRSPQLQAVLHRRVRNFLVQGAASLRNLLRHCNFYSALSFPALRCSLRILENFFVQLQHEVHSLGRGATPIDALNRRKALQQHIICAPHKSGTRERHTITKAAHMPTAAEAAAAAAAAALAHSRLSLPAVTSPTSHSQFSLLLPALHRKKLPLGAPLS